MQIVAKLWKLNKYFVGYKEKYKLSISSISESFQIFITEIIVYK